MENQVLTKEELQSLQQLQGRFNSLKMSLGDIEMQKHDIMREVDMVKMAFAENEKNLIQKYGADAVINMATGEVTKKDATKASPMQVTKK